MRLFSTQAMQTLPSVIDGREAIFREQVQVARVAIDNAEVLKGTLKFRITYRASSGLCGSGKSHQLEAHGSSLFATTRYLSADQVGWQIFLSQKVIDNTLAIVAKLGPNQTYLSDYVSSPVLKKDSKFSAIKTPGPIAKSLFEFLRQQQIQELQQPSILIT